MAERVCSPTKKIPTVEDTRLAWTPPNEKSLRRAKEQKLHRLTAVIGTDLSLARKQGSWYLLQKHRERVAGRVGIRLVAGSKDVALEGVRRSHESLNELKVPHQFEVVPDIKHGIRKYFRLAGQKSLQFQLEWFRTAGNEQP